MSNAQAPQENQITDPQLALLGKLALARLNDLPEISHEMKPMVDNILIRFQGIITNIHKQQEEAKQEEAEQPAEDKAEEHG